MIKLFDGFSGFKLGVIAMLGNNHKKGTPMIQRAELLNRLNIKPHELNQQVKKGLPINDDTPWKTKYDYEEIFKYLTDGLDY
jgi:hypothetical protein